MFSGFKSLHVLVLMGHYLGEAVDELPSSIRKLIHLRCLDISRKIIEYLPDSIGELYHLQTLRACHYLKKLPNTLKYMISLRHLHIPRIPRIELPPEIGRLTSLQTLPYFGVGDEKGRKIGELGSLKNLKGDLEIYDLEKVHDKEEAKSADLLQKPNIFKLRLAWSKNKEGENNDANVLEGLEPHPKLKRLEIWGFRGRSFPSWCSKMTGLNKLVEIRLVKCKECEEVPMLGHLPHLKFLYLCGLANVTSIGSSFYGIDNCSTSIIVFPTLEVLVLESMSNLTEWLDAAENRLCEVVVFPCLEYLKIKDCRQLTSAPSHFPCLKELEIFHVDSGSPLESICGVKLTSLTKLEIKSIDGLVRLPDWLFHNNGNIWQLKILNCPNLTHLVPDLGGGGASLKELEIQNCLNLIALPDDLYSVNSLQTLTIYDCPNITRLFMCLESGGASSLRELNIQNYSSLIELHSPDSLETLSIFDCPNLTHLFPCGACLRKLEISFCSSLKELPDNRNVIFDAILKGSTQSLVDLKLGGMEHWDSLPDQLQHLSALSKLHLIGLGMEALPEWIGNLSSLQSLSLRFCQKLRSLPSKEAMRGLTKLTHLDIFICPPLKERYIAQQRNDDSEWLKISHIPEIEVDMELIQSHGRPEMVVGWYSADISKKIIPGLMMLNEN